jgi:hypothetical protein
LDDRELKRRQKDRLKAAQKAEKEAAAPPAAVKASAGPSDTVAESEMDASVRPALLSAIELISSPSRLFMTFDTIRSKLYGRLKLLIPILTNSTSRKLFLGLSNPGVKRGRLRMARPSSGRRRSVMMGVNEPHS